MFIKSKDFVYSTRKSISALSVDKTTKWHYIISKIADINTLGEIMIKNKVLLNGYIYR